MNRRWVERLLLLGDCAVALYMSVCFLPLVDGMTLLMRASRSGDVSLARTLLQMGARPNQRDWMNGGSALVLAAANGHTDVARMLLAAGADPNQLDDGGRTALCHAGTLSRIHPHTFQALLDGGADPNAGRWNALECLFGQGEILEKARLLLDAGVAIDGKDGRGGPIIEAARTGQDRYLTLLLARGAKVDARGLDGRTALMEAAARGRLECVRVLLSAGANPSAVDTRGATAAQIATQSPVHWGEPPERYRAVVDLLREPANGSPP